PTLSPCGAQPAAGRYAHLPSRLPLYRPPDELIRRRNATVDELPGGRGLARLPGFAHARRVGRVNRTEARAVRLGWGKAAVQLEARREIVSVRGAADVRRRLVVRAHHEHGLWRVSVCVVE